MLKTSSIKSAKSKKGVVGINGNNKAGGEKNELDGSRIDGSKVDGSNVRDNEVGKKV